MNTPDATATIGDNNPPADWAKLTTDELSLNYASSVREVTALLEEARAFPARIEDNETFGKGKDLVVRLRKAFDTLDGHREKEKAPHETRYTATNNWFFGWMEKLKRRNKNAAAGAADIIYARVDDYNQKLLAAEEARRRQEALDARMEADRLLAEAENAERNRIEAERAAARAIKPQHIETKTAVAEQAAGAAAVKQVEAMIANDKAEVAETYAAAKPADMVRDRSDGGTLSTMGTEKYAIVDGDEGYALLDKEKLWPFIKRDEIDKALRKWAETTGHAVQMPGAKIGRRPKTRIGG